MIVRDTSADRIAGVLAGLDLAAWDRDGFLHLPAVFAQLDGAVAATDLRRWDDLAKDPDRPTVRIATYTALLARLARVPRVSLPADE